MTTTDYFFILLTLLVLYLGAFSTVNRFQHPEKTETQLFLDLREAFMVN